VPPYTGELYQFNGGIGLFSSNKKWSTSAATSKPRRITIPRLMRRFQLLARCVSSSFFRGEAIKWLRVTVDLSL
jgi:hypothetical protein